MLQAILKSQITYVIMVSFLPLIINMHIIYKDTCNSLFN